MALPYEVADENRVECGGVKMVVTPVHSIFGALLGSRQGKRSPTTFLLDCSTEVLGAVHART